MKNIILIHLALCALGLKAQTWTPYRLSAAYWGETIAHPGARLSADFAFKRWEKTKKRASGEGRLIRYELDFRPSAGFFNSPGFQTSLFAMSGIQRRRVRVNGNFRTAYAEVGYMHTFIPDTYALQPSGEIEKTIESRSHLAAGLGFAWGKELSALPLALYVGPQLLYAYPWHTKGVFYFTLEAGCAYRLAN